MLQLSDSCKYTILYVLANGKTRQYVANIRFMGVDWLFFLGILCLLSQTTFTILHNEERYPSSYETLDFVFKVNKLGGGMCM